MKISCDYFKKLFCCRCCKNKKIRHYQVELRINQVYLNNLPNQGNAPAFNHHRERSTDMVDMRTMIKWNGYIGAKK